MWVIWRVVDKKDVAKTTTLHSAFQKCIQLWETCWISITVLDQMQWYGVWKGHCPPELIAIVEYRGEKPYHVADPTACDG